ISDEASFAAIKRNGRESDYKNYLTLCHRHVNEVKAELPTIALRDAKQANSSTALLEVIKNYPDSPVAAEAKTLLPAVAEREAQELFKQAAGSVKQLRELIYRYPQTSVAAEAKNEIHKIYQQQLVTFREHVSNDPKVIIFFEKLLNNLE